MAEAVSTLMQIAKAVVEIERELLPVPEPVSVLPEVASVQPSTARSPEPAAAKTFTQKSYVEAAQLTLTALFQKLGAQGKGRRKRKPAALPEQQLSLFRMLAATD
jgi:hypothetical protein